MLLAFAPFIAFAAIDRLVGPVEGMFAGFAVSAALLIRDWSQGHRPKVLEIGTAALFVAPGCYALVADPAWSLMGRPSGRRFRLAADRAGLDRDPATFHAAIRTGARSGRRAGVRGICPHQLRHYRGLGSGFRHHGGRRRGSDLHARSAGAVRHYSQPCWRWSAPSSLPRAIQSAAARSPSLPRHFASAARRAGLIVHFINPAAVSARVMTAPTSMPRRFGSLGTGLVGEPACETRPQRGGEIGRLQGCRGSRWDDLRRRAPPGRFAGSD